MEDEDGELEEEGGHVGEQELWYKDGYLLDVVEEGVWWTVVILGASDTRCTNALKHIIPQIVMPIDNTTEPQIEHPKITKIKAIFAMIPVIHNLNQIKIIHHPRLNP